MNRDSLQVSAARLSIAAIATYQILLVVLLFLRPDLDPTWHTISEWAIGKWGWLMTTGFLLSGVSYTALFIAIRTEVSGTTGKIGLILFVLCIIGTFGVGIFTTDPMTQLSKPSLRGQLHIVSGSSALLLLPFAALLISLDIASRNITWIRSKRMLRFGAWLPLLGFIAFVAYTVLYVMPKSPTVYGPGVNIGIPPRVAFLTYAIWVIILASLRISPGRRKTQ